jgi:hypothetical protein
MNEEIKIRTLPPAWFIEMIAAFRRGLILLNKRMFPAPVVLYEHFQYFWLLPCLKVAAELDIAGLLRNGPLTIAELAAETKADPTSLFRIMRALASHGIFRQDKLGRFVNTRMSGTLTDGKGSLRHMVLQHLGKVNWTVLSELSHTVRTGEHAFEKVYHKTVYEFLAENPEHAALFDRSMTNLSDLAIEPILNAYNFSGHRTIADIGGGEGLLLATLLFKHPHLKGILADIPQGLVNAESIIRRYGVEGRMTLFTENFFDTIPTGADLYLLKNILHNWGDAECIRILGNIKNVLPENGKILIMEMVVDEENRPSFGKLLDIQMMVFMKDAKERTAGEFRDLVQGAGLRIARIVKTISPICLIEVVQG